MKSFFLEGRGGVVTVRNELSRLFPGQCDPWILMADNEDPIAYLHVENRGDDTWSVQVDISGRHFDHAPLVLRVLAELQGEVGGRMTDDDGRNL